MGKCTILAHVRNPKGEVVESRLYKDLLHYTSNNRQLTKEYYAVGTNESFLSRVKDSAEFDENGEITFKSLQRLANLQVNENSLMQVLNKDLGAGEMTYDEAISKLAAFNRNSSYNNSYMATITPSTNGMYTLSVVKKNKANQVSLGEVIANQTLQNRIKYQLNKAGVAVDFMETDEKVNGRYSTKNATKTANGLYQLIKIANGEHIESTLAEEAGHFVVGAMGKSPLVQRLLNLLNEDVQRRVLGENYEGKYFGDSARREVAGTLIGEALLGNVDKRTPWQSLVNRIVTNAKKIFATIKGDEILKASLEAKEIAEYVAAGFMSDKFEGTVEEALSTRETLYSATSSFNVRTFRDVLGKLKVQASEMGQISSDLFKKFNQLAGQVELGRDVNSPGIFGDAIALEGIAEAVSLMHDLMQAEIPDLLASVDFGDISDFYANMPRNAKALRAVRVYAKNALAIIDIIERATSVVPGAQSLQGDISNIQIVDALGNPVSHNLLDIANSLKSILSSRNGLLNELANKESQFFLRFLEDSLGSTYISRAARVIFKLKKGEKLIQFKSAEDIPISDLMKTLDSDISFFEKWIASMSNSSDVIGQIVDKTAKYANKVADDITRNDFAELQKIKNRFEELRKRKLISDTRELYEVGLDGKLTGNIRSEFRMGEWEYSFEKQKRQALEDFKNANPDLDSKSDFEKGVMWDNYFKPIAKQWHKLNSTFVIDPVTNEGRYVPNITYRDSSWDNLPSEVQNLISDIVQLKRNIDSRLGETHTRDYRAPQFKGTFMDKVRNRRLYENASSAITHTVIGGIRDTFCESSEDTEYGSNSTYNSEEEQLFSDKIAFEREKLNRVPLYGINKLADLSELSTDIFHSMLAYAGMANQYAALSKIVDTLEVGKEVLSERKVEGLKSEKQRDKTSAAFTRYTKFLDKQVYGISAKKIYLPLGVLVDKITGFLTGSASKVYLGGNVAGGIVNLGTGTIEIFKEAFSGEYFTQKDWLAANAEYFKYVAPNILGTGKEVKTDKVSLFIQYFDVLSDNKKDWRNWNTRRSRILNFFGRSLWLPYKSGEHYMQSIPYIGLAINTKLYDENGNETNLWEALQVEDISGTKKGRELSYKGKTYFKDRANIATYNMISDIIAQIDNVMSSTSILGPTLQLSHEQQSYLASKGYNIANLKGTKTQLTNDIQSLIWSESDETTFQVKAREITNRMHGIYNNSDKVMFQQTIYGNMALAMRGYALGMFERRFGSSKYSVSLGDETGGSVADAIKVFLLPFMDKSYIPLTVRALLLPFGDKTKQQMLNAGFSMHQYRNMRRNFGDFAFIAMLMIIKALTAKQGGGDDKDEEVDDTTMGLAYYFSSRLLREQRALNTIRGIKDESSSLLDIEPVGVSVLGDMWDLTYGFIGQQFVEPSYERLEGDEKPENYIDFYYNSKKEGLYNYGDSKAEKKFWRMFPYYRSIYVFENPYDAAASFEYGKKVK